MCRSLCMSSTILTARDANRGSTQPQRSKDRTWTGKSVVAICGRWNTRYSLRGQEEKRAGWSWISEGFGVSGLGLFYSTHNGELWKFFFLRQERPIRISSLFRWTAPQSIFCWIVKLNGQFAFNVSIGKQLLKLKLGASQWQSPRVLGERNVLSLSYIPHLCK